VITDVLVALPARDEAARIGNCLRSIDAAAALVAGDVRTTIVVAADSCSDGTAAVARRAGVRTAEVVVLDGRWSGVGAARAAAVCAGLDHVAVRPANVWIANTDADTVVRADWLRSQLRHAATQRAVAGIVELDPSRTPRALLERFRSSYRLDGARHTHVHGANLGVRADTYLEAGGWSERTRVGEDHGLWARLVATGHPVIQSTTVRVVTSARTTSRVTGGFATDLRALVPGRSVALVPPGAGGVA
jgi:glycosyltransferase involved in cell wall biosynthesis